MMAKKYLIFCLAITVAVILSSAQEVFSVDLPIIQSQTTEYGAPINVAAEPPTPPAPAEMVPVAVTPAETLAPEDPVQLQKKYAELLQEKEHLALDRDNLFLQVKTLLQERLDYQDAKDQAVKLAAENELLRKEQDVLSKENSEYEAKAATLEQDLQQAKTDLQNTQLLTSKSAQLERIEELQDKLDFSQKTKESLVEVMQQMEQRIKASEAKASELMTEITRKDAEAQRLNLNIATLESDYKALASENNYLKDKVVKMPSEFAGLAHENKKLKRQTADMHYNLGVFYTQNKEFKRAGLEFMKAVELRPDDASAHYNLGYIFAEHLMDQPKAVEHFKEYLRITKGKDKDADKAKKYILIWETYGQNEVSNIK
ncbi:MAG: hypothetical protein V1727_06080 [Candidatus Omnitrophota bacterium]